MPGFRFGVGVLLSGGLIMASQAGPDRMAAGPLQGQWAGERMQFVIDAKGGRVELECASGTIAGPVTPGSDGKFSAAGTFEQHQGGPTRADAAAPASARYSGEVQGGNMKLSILVDGASAPQVFNLQQGARIKLIRCL